METLFLILATFMLNPTYEKVEYTQKDINTIGAMVKKSWYMKECSITWPLGTKKGIVVLWIVCAKWDNWVYNAKLGIDYEHKLYMRTR